MSRRTALGAFCAGNGAFELAMRRIATPAQRTFSSTAQRNKEMVYFTKTSSPELDELLAEIRHKIILPAYLPKDQRKRIYSKKYEKRLQTDPLTIEIDGEVTKFRYTDPFTQVPQTRRSLFRALALFRTPRDFANLRPLVEGIANAKHRLLPDDYGKIVRVAGLKGHAYQVIELARAVKRTGFRLDASERVVELLWHVQMKAVDAGWEAEETLRALRWAELVVELLQEDDHKRKVRGDEEPVPGQLPLWRDPLVLLAPLHLAAALARSSPESADGLDKVRYYANAIALLWDEGKNLRQIQPAVLFERKEELEYLAENNKFVKIATPYLYGLEAAIEVLKGSEPELAAKLQTRHDSLAAEIAEARKDIRGYIGEQTWRRVFEGERPERPEGEEDDGEK